MIDKFVAALVGAPFGVKGFVKIKPFSGEREHLEQLETVLLRRENRETPFHIEETTRIGPSLGIKFRGIDTPEAAKTITGAELVVDRAHAAPLLEDEYYVEDLRGVEVLDRDGKVLGEVHDVIEGGGGQLIEVKLTGGEHRLAPFRKEFFGAIDMEKRTALLLEPWVLE
ncbi:16S rRNA processing protein RimM [Treponema primitia ZAS-2]|uniref:Ribosome maturation factor RimM n=1 Tax=Treponema primitia (strain ATCC BAA-887 / DSM 12427 / ZAS-2) TaxID=545694 RepID=F5YLS4_TREPZ|nr:ribosome maturation factor RimM [Treponema primitia]AEF84160.1 16S rRNA processing protein RimM [Treponema primitia ZAS-2]